MTAALLLGETAFVAAVLVGWTSFATGSGFGADAAAGPVMGVLTLAMAGMFATRVWYSRQRRRLSGGWWGADAVVRQVATPLAIGGCVAFAIWAAYRASVGQKLGDAGSLLVLLTVAATGAKLAAETYLFAQLGGDPSPRQASARALIGPLAWLAKTRYALGILGGVILPLGAQILAGGSKNIPAVADAGPPAMLAVAALVCLVPGELLERRLFWSDAVVEPAEASSS